MASNKENPDEREKKPSILNQITRAMKKILNKNEDEDFSEDDLKKIKKFEMCSKQNENLNDSICSEFSTIYDELFGEKVIEMGLIKNDLFACLKPHIFDSLKRINRLTEIKNCVSRIKFTDEKWRHLIKIEERDLICSTIQFLNLKSKAKFGTLLAENSYPCPLVFSEYNLRTMEKKLSNYNIYFDLFNDLLGLSNKLICVVSGTKSCIFKGKSSLIPIILDGVNSVFTSKKGYVKKNNNVDLIVSKNSDWLVADFHAEIQMPDVKNLLKSFTAYSTLHIMNVTLDDFKSNGEFEGELKEIFEWHDVLYNKSVSIPSHLVILIRDYQENKELLKKITRLVAERFSSVIAVPFISYEKDNDNGEIKKVVDNFSKLISNLFKKSMHSIHDIEKFYRKLNHNELDFKLLNGTRKFGIETQFLDLFHNYESKTYENVFPLANINSKVFEAEENLNKIGYYDPKRNELEIKLNELKLKAKQLNPFSQYIHFFVEIIIGANFISEVIILENLFIEFKKCKLELLRKNQSDKQSELDHLTGRIKNLESSSKTENELLPIKEAKITIEIEVESLNDKIAVYDLTIDKFWDEIFSIYDWIIDLEKHNLTLIDDSLKSNIKNFKLKIPQLINRYIELLEYGFSIHLLRSKPLKIKSKALEMVFEKLKSDQELYIITVIGEQSSAKSSLLNSLFGCNFRTSAGRCTIGIYMNCVNYKNKKIIILDTEGLMSVESGDRLFDNQLATMAVLSSHMIIVNHKGEISSNLERLLGITFYAKLQTSKSVFKPSLMFVLRDQTERNKSSVATQASKLKTKLVDQASKIKHSIDDVMNIEIENITLLSNAFAEERCDWTGREKKWRNSIFPDQIVQLRKLILEKLERMNKTGHSFNSLNGLYSSMCSYWKTLEDLGFGILNCKDLEEIKMRNEISTKCNALIVVYGDRFHQNCEKIIENRQYELEKEYSEEVVSEAIFEIRTLYDQNLSTIFQDFDKQIDISYFPEELKREYRSRLEQSLERIKYICITAFNNFSSHIKEVKQLENMRNEMVKTASDLIKRELIGEDFNELIIRKMDSFDSKYEEILTKPYENENSFIKKIQNSFNQNHGQLIYADKFEDLKTIPKMYDLEEFINGSYRIIPSAWFDDSFGTSIQLKLSGINKSEVIASLKVLIKRDMIPKAVRSINKPFVEDSHIRNVFEIINDSLLNLNSPLRRFKALLCINKIISDIFKAIFEQMYIKYTDIQKNELEANRSKYDSMKRTLILDIENNIQNMKDSKKCGEAAAEQLIKNIERVLKQDSETRIEKEINKLMIDTLKNPEELVNHAFDTSFLSLDYEKVFHYATNTQQYFDQVSQKLTENKLKSIIASEVNYFEMDFSEFIKLFDEFDIYMVGTTIHEFIDCIVEKTCFSMLKKNYLKRIKETMINLEITNIDHFNIAFKETVIKKILECQKSLKLNAVEIKNKANFINKACLKKCIGCLASCPGCGSKCHLQIGHVGSHKSAKHILNGFVGWHDKDSKLVNVEYCWAKQFYSDSRIQFGKKVYDNFVTFLTERYPDWLNDIRENFIKYSGGANEVKNFTDYNYFMRKSWMNVRQPIIKKYKLVDKEYENDWLNLEDQHKMLKKNFKLEHRK